MRCDFCSSPAVVVSYPAYSSRMVFKCKDGEIFGDAIGGWVACAECAQLIDAGDHEGLAKRSAETFPMITPAGLNRAEVAVLIRRIQDEMFWTHLRGPGVPIPGLM